MQVIAYDKFVTAERFRELGVEGVDDPDELYARADFITLHLPKTPETVNFIDAEAIGKMRDGVRIVNCARGELIDLDALIEGLESGKVAGAALDVFPEEPFTGHPILERDDVVVTPHLGASTAEAQDRAGVVTAEQVTAALTGGVVTTAVNIAAVRPEVMEQLAPFVPLCEKLGRLAQALGEGAPDRVEVEFRGRLADQDTRILGIATLVGILSGHTEEPVNLVNGPHMAEERGIELTETRDASSEDFTELVVVQAPHRRRRRRGRRHRRRAPQHPLSGAGLGRRLLPALRRPPGDLPLHRPAGNDRPGRDDLRRGERQHRLGRGRGRVGRRHGGDGAHHRRSGQSSPRSTGSSSSTASRSVAPSLCDGLGCSIWLVTVTMKRCAATLPLVLGLLLGAPAAASALTVSTGSVNGVVGVDTGGVKDQISTGNSGTQAIVSDSAGPGKDVIIGVEAIARKP